MVQDESYQVYRAVFAERNRCATIVWSTVAPRSSIKFHGEG